MLPIPLLLNDLMEKNKYLYGASGHCKVIIDILKSNNDTISAVFDDNLKETELHNVKVLDASKIKFSSLDEFIISIGDNRIRKIISDKIFASFFTAIHCKAVVSDNSQIDKGSVVMAGVVINSDVTIGKHCIINSGAVIEHDCLIHDYAHISPNVSLAGNVVVGEGSHVGIGTSVIQGIKIGKWVTIGAGSVIIRDIPDFAVVVGNPGKIIKYNKANE